MTVNSAEFLSGEIGITVDDPEGRPMRGTIKNVPAGIGAVGDFSTTVLFFGDEHIALGPADVEFCEGMRQTVYRLRAALDDVQRTCAHYAMCRVYAAKAGETVRDDMRADA